MSHLKPFYKHEIVTLFYICLGCNQVAKKNALASDFKRKCPGCNLSCGLNFIKPSFTLLYGAYRCFRTRCGSIWTEMLPFEFILRNTPICLACNKLAKISKIIYRRKKFVISHKLLYKCRKCYKCKVVTHFNYQVNICLKCNTPMHLQTRLRSIYSFICVRNNFYDKNKKKYTPYTKKKRSYYQDKRKNF